VTASALPLSVSSSHIFSGPISFLQFDMACGPSKVLGSPVGFNPVGIAFESANGNLYVTNSNDKTVSVISTTLTLSEMPWIETN